jgi:hypothetical protein
VAVSLAPPVLDYWHSSKTCLDERLAIELVKYSERLPIGALGARGKVDDFLFRCEKYEANRTNRVAIAAQN